MTGARWAGIDLRLVGPAVGAWLGALFMLRGAAGVAVVAAGLAAVAVAAAAMTWQARRRRPLTAPGPAHSVRQRPVALVPLLAIVAGVLLGTACGMASTVTRTAARDASPLRDLVRERAEVAAELVVTDDARPVRPGSGRPATWLVPATLLRVAADGRGMRLRVRVLALGSDAAWPDLLPGQHVRASGRLGPARGGDLRAAVLHVPGAPERWGAPPWIQRAAGDLRAALRRACSVLPTQVAGLLPALVVGDTARLDPMLEEDFRVAGMTHLLAVSGANLAIVVSFILLLARSFRVGPRLAAVLGGLVLVGFVVLARPSPSVLRAGVMSGLALLALAAGRPKAAVPALALTVFALVVVNPELAAQLGFALSALATAGLLLLAPPMRDALRRRGVPRGLAEALAMPVAAQIACAPVVAASFGTVSLVAVPANLLAMPAVAPATVLGVVVTVLAAIWLAAAQALVWLAAPVLWWIVQVARVAAELPGAALSWPHGPLGGLALAALALGILAALLFVVRHRIVRATAVVVVAAVAVGVAPVATVGGWPRWPPPSWVLVACAVGQGDALVVPSASGQAVVVDAGPDPVAVDRCLGRLGVAAVSALVVSHFHADHVGGVAGVFRGRRVAAVLAPDFAEPAAGHRAVTDAAARAGLGVTRPYSGWVAQVGSVRLEVIGPAARRTGTRSDPNNNSLVLRMTAGGVTFLLPGDVEVAAQAALLARDAPVRADVLKVPHHGSAFQDPGFLDAVDPAVAIVCVGAGNDYGHPNRAVLDRLRHRGARVLRTDRDGDIAVVRTAGGIAVASHGVVSGRHPP